MTKIGLFTLLSILLFVGCQAGEPTLAPSPFSTPTPTRTPKPTLNIPDLPSEEGKTWLETDPIQCGENPWEKFWEENEEKVPEMCSNQCETAEEKVDWKCQVACLIREYYSRQGVDIFDIRMISFEEKFGTPIPICEACCCPSGSTIYLQVSNSDVDTMLQMSYRHIVTSCETADPKPYGCKWLQ